MHRTWKIQLWLSTAALVVIALLACVSMIPPVGAFVVDIFPFEIFHVCFWLIGLLSVASLVAAMAVAANNATTGTTKLLIVANILLLGIPAALVGSAGADLGTQFFLLAASIFVGPIALFAGCLAGWVRLLEARQAGETTGESGEGTDSENSNP